MKKSSALCLLGAAGAAALPFFLFAPGKATRTQRREFTGVNFAHRGLHSKDKSVPENSLEGFRLAAEAGYGIELDVRLCKDGQAVVFHDSNLKRVCGVDRRVDELTYAELSEISLCGTEQHVPLFTEALEVIAGRSPLIVELKGGRKNAELCRKTYEILSAYEGKYCIESFDPGIVAWFRFHAPNVLRGQLAMRYEHRREYPDLTGPLWAICFYNFLARPQFIAYRLEKHPLSVRLAEGLGAMRFCWTSREPMADKSVDGVIFEFYRPETRFR